MAGIIKKKKSAYGKRRKKKSKTYDAYMAAMAACAEAVVDVDGPAVVVADVVVRYRPASASKFLRCCHRRIPAAPRAGRLLVQSRRVTALLPRLMLMFMCPLLRYHPAPASIFLRCCHRRILASPQAGRLIVWSRRVTARSPKRRPSS